VPNTIEAHTILGVAYENLGRHQEAIESYKQAIRIKPDYAKAHYGLGLVYASPDLCRWQEAIEALKQAIRIKPDYVEAHFFLGVTYLMTGDKGSALEEYKILKTLDVDKANELFNLIYQ
jgi:tetratricopeptide (TPR) repeat protein